MKSAVAYGAIGVALLLLVVWLDYISGSELSFFVFYFLPLSLVSWYTNRYVGTAFAAVATGTWVVVDYFEGRVYTLWLARYWNAGVRFIAFLTIALAFAYIKQKLLQEQQLTRQLTTALAEVKRLSGFLPICAACKKIRNDQGYWEQIETYIRDHSEAEFTHSICPECMPKLYPNLPRSPQ
jgi:hypothetical protein